MSKGALLFAYNNGITDYYSMAIAAAKRIKHFLNIPVTLVTSSDSLTNEQTVNLFDKIIIQEPESGNSKEGALWLNKGRFHAWNLTPYDETLLIDVDYVVNSNKLLNLFELYDDFMCHDTTSYLMIPNADQELISNISFKTLWATVIVFKKTSRTKQIFDCMEMIQNNYEHYASIHNFLPNMYRNDYSLTLALRIVNGQSDNNKDIIPWNLLHADYTVKIEKMDNTTEFDTTFKVNINTWKNGKVKKEYMIIKDTDFHMMDKLNFNELILK